ncbi:ABC transporter ATP-binding protein [Mycoplana rhizolycopersici]|uniref:ATP-binding cassette domain-containing protein n=1 Tax=Mycoplana rhizolycopersici TaxID=2746702 RepID=A0ABX2QJW8_9HYPH|nr:ATP-binding cassette domain-containing protein [Rhizobium rhizolycopersici]NVP56853.1 ATP-binding cassette domain-containing protein [Rhizobium rhizolycopersici]
MIRIEQAIKRYGQTCVVDGVTLTLPAGGVTSIVGPNGAGKSTLLAMISRLLGMDGGAISVGGLDVTKTPGDVLARRLSILRQDNSLTARLTVRDLVAFGRYPHSKGRMTDDDARRIEEALAYLDLKPLADRFLDELSGGLRQRAFVAMVLCQDTEYMMFDEPLNNLDIKHAVTMMRLLRRAADELGKTVVVVLHDINFASCHSDRIVAMQDGRVLCQGTPQEIVRPDVLEAIYGTSFVVQEIGGKRIATYFE